MPPHECGQERQSVRMPWRAASLCAERKALWRTGSVQVMLFRDRLEVWNPERLPKGMTVEKLAGEHASLPVNPLLANPVYLAGYIEQVGTGTNDVIDRCVELGLRKPEFHQDENFMVVMWRKEVTGTENGEVNGTLNGTLNSKQKDVLAFITTTPGVQAQEIIDRLSIPRDTLNKILKVLIDRKLIERRGSKKTGGYYVK